MKFCTIVQNFGDELGRLSYEATTIPRLVFETCSANLRELIDSLISDVCFCRLKI